MKIIKGKKSIGIVSDNIEEIKKIQKKLKGQDLETHIFSEFAGLLTFQEVIDTAKKILSDNKKHHAQIFMLKKETNTTITKILDFQDEEHKTRECNFLRQFIFEQGVEDYILVTEGWLVSQTMDDPHIRPRFHKDRKEALIICHFNKFNKSEQYIGIFERTEKDEIVFKQETNECEQIDSAYDFFHEKEGFNVRMDKLIEEKNQNYVNKIISEQLHRGLQKMPDNEKKAFLETLIKIAMEHPEIENMRDKLELFKEVSGGNCPTGVEIISNIQANIKKGISDKIREDEIND